MAEDTGNNIPKLPSSGNGKSGKKNNEKDILDSTGSKSAGDAVDDAKKKAKTAGKVAKTVGNIIQAIASIPVAGPIIIGIIILIIIIIGVYYFVTTIPGLAISAIKSFVQNGVDLVQSWFTTEADAYTNEVDVIDLANYLEEMEYDLIGNGFIVPSSETNSSYVTYEELLEEGYLYGIKDYNGNEAYRYYKEDGTVYDGLYYNSLGVLIDNTTGSIVESGVTGLFDANTGESYYIDKYGLWRSTENISSNGQGEIIGVGDANVKLLRTYLLSDYRIYAIRNNDSTSTNNAFAIIKKVFGGYDSAWSKGLMKFYYAEDGLATKEWSQDFLASATNNWIDLGDAIQVNGTKLSIKQGTFNNAINFDIDGWADRYGMSLEFLLSLHLATGAPDLVYAMLQSFDTEVQVYLNDSGEASVEGGYVDLIDDSATTADLITWNDLIATLETAGDDGVINAIQEWLLTNDDRINLIDKLALTKKLCQYLLLNLPLESPDNCTGQAQAYVIETSTSDSFIIEKLSSNVLTSYGVSSEKEKNENVYENGIYELIDEYEAYEVEDNSFNFDASNMDVSLGTSNSEYETNDYYSYFADSSSGVDLSDYNYVESNAEIEGPIIDEFETVAQTTTDALASYSGAGSSSTIYTIYKIKRVKTTRTYTGEVDGEEVEYTWTTFKYLIYKAGSRSVITTSSMFNSETTTTDTYLDDPEWVDTVMFEIIIREKTDPELVDAGLATYDESTDTYTYINADETKCSEQTDLTKCCKNCQKYVKKVLKAMANITDENYAFYTPYISRVLGSWFRDTYFVIPEEEDKAIQEYIGEASRSSAEMSTISNSYGYNGSYVIVDEEYLAETEEYWTAYEMKPETDENGNVVKDSDGNTVYTDEYQLYYMEPNGTTSNTTMENFIADIKAYLNENDYTAEEWAALPDSCATQEDAEALGFVFVKKAQTRSASEVASNSENAATIGTEVIWSAYSFGTDGVTGWQKTGYGEGNEYIDAVYDQIGGEDAVKNTDDGGFYYNITSANTVTQTEDAQRSETNSTVKWLFKYRKYYIYDGTTDVALTIADDKEAVLDAVTKFLKDKYGSAGKVARDFLGKYGRSALRQTYGALTITFDWDDVSEQWLEWQLDMYYSGVVSDYVTDDGDVVTYDGVMLTDIKWSDYGLDEDRDYGDPRDPDLIGTVNITKNSLNAFTILENTKTYAAEYAYRDFKELIVELNYFDKEDLSEKVDSVFTWILPELGSSGWPVRPWDKQNVDYGALIESSGTYEYLEEVDYDPSVTGADLDEDEDENENTDGVDDTDTTTGDTSNNTSDNTGDEETEESDEYDLDALNADTDVDEDNEDNSTISDSEKIVIADTEEETIVAENATTSVYSVPTSTTSSEGNQTIISKAQEVVQVMYNGNWSYQSGCWNNRKTWAAAQSASPKVTSCATFVSWVLQESGYCESGKMLSHGAKGSSTESVYNTYSDNLTNATWLYPNCTTSSYDLLPGDVVIVENGDWRSIAIYAGEDSSGNNLYYGGICDSFIDREYSNINNSSLPGAAKMPSFDSGKLVIVVRFDGGETTASSFAGYEGGEMVSSPVTGKIIEYGTHKRTNVYTGDTEEVGYITIKVLDSDELFTESNVTNNSNDFEASDEDAANGLNLFYEEYEDTCAGYIVTIDGFKLDMNAEDESGNYGMYEENEVVALYNSEEQEKREANEESKYNAPFFINIGGSDGVGSLPEEYTAADSDTGYYIKEGKYIGTTYTDEESAANVTVTVTDESSTTADTASDDSEEEFVYDGPANYIRIIVKDTDYSIIDNVEDFFDIPETEQASGDVFTGEYSEEFLYWLLIDTEGAGGGDSSLESAITQGYSIAGDIGDGTITAAFGVTNWCNSLFWSLGYEQYVNYIQGSNVGMNAGDHIPISVCNDVAIAELDSDVATIESEFPGMTFTETQMAALISVSYNFGSIPNTLKTAILSGNESTIQSVWTNLGSSQWSEYPGLEGRRSNEYKMWSEGKYYNCYGSGELVFSSDTPFTDYLNGNFDVCTYSN